MNRSGVLAAGWLSCLTVMFLAVSPCAGEVAGVGGPLILEIRRDDFGGKLIQMECRVREQEDFFVATRVDRIRWTFQGHVGRIEDGVVALDALVESHAESATPAQMSYGGMQLKIDDVSGVDGGLASGGFGPGWRFWIRRGLDPLPAVRKCLRRRDESFWAAAEYVERLRPDAKSVIPLLVDALSDGKDSSDRPDYQTVRGRAAEALGKMGPLAAEAVPALAAALHDSNGYVRVDAAVALWRIERQGAAAAVLVTETKDDQWGVRHHAVVGLGEVAGEQNAPAAIPALTKALRDKNRGVRLQACYSLAKFRSDAKPALQALTNARGDESEDVRRAAAYALQQIGR